MSFLQYSFSSKYLCGSTEISIILPNRPMTAEPADFYGSGKKYPVIWLLHGLTGGHSDWMRNTSIERYACDHDIAVVMPSAMSSEYTNWPSVMSMAYNFFDFFTKELMPLIYNWFPVSTEPKDNFIAGLSMGGGGALRIAASHPELFGGVACLSSCAWDFSCLEPYADMTGTEFHKTMTAPDMKDWLQSHGIPTPFLSSICKFPTVRDFLNSHENTRARIAEAVRAGKMPRTYNVCGTLDDGYKKFLDYKKFCEDLGADMEFEIYDDIGHVWALWDITIQKAITYFGFDK